MTQHPALSNFVSKLQRNPKTDLQSLLQLKKEVILDDAQARSFLVGLTQKVSLIQGPPGMVDSKHWCIALFRIIWSIDGAVAFRNRAVLHRRTPR